MRWVQRVRESVLSEGHKPLLPDLDADLRRQLGIRSNASEDSIAKIWERCATDPEFYIFGGFVRTFDEKDHKYKPFPTTPYLKYTLNYIHQGGPGDICAIPKTRQMKLTWLIAAECSWEAKFHTAARVMWQSKKDQDACSIVYRNSWFHSRIGFIERALPPFMWSTGLKGTKGDLWYPNGSIISAIPQGPDMFRSYSPSLVVGDECCFQPEFEEAYGAMLPAIKGDPNVEGSGARAILISSARAGTFFGELIEANEEERIAA